MQPLIRYFRMCLNSEFSIRVDRFELLRLDPDAHPVMGNPHSTFCRCSQAYSSVKVRVPSIPTLSPVFFFLSVSFAAHMSFVRLRSVQVLVANVAVIIGGTLLLVFRTVLLVR